MSSDLLILVVGGLVVGLAILGWVAVRRFSTVPKILLRSVIVVLAVLPLTLAMFSLEAPQKVAIEAPTGARPPELAERSAPQAPALPPPPPPGAPRSAEVPEAGKAGAPPDETTSSQTTGQPEPPAVERRAPARTIARQRPAPPADDAWQVVPVFYGTDRTRAERPAREPVPVAANGPDLRVDYGAGRAGRLELGQALVTVPKVHQVPLIERPWVYKIPLTNIVLYAEKEDPAKHFTLQEVEALSREDLLALVKERLAASREYAGHAIVFVHGYNTTFDYALYRTAQIAYDLGFDGAPFVYSWPSDGAILSYPYDRESAEQAQPYLREFLDMVTRETGATSVSIIAHSMGNQLLLPVLRELKRSAPPGIAISELILAAPDVGRDSFAFLAREIRGLARGVTLYASATDRALLASRQFWSTPRAGEVVGEGPFVLDGVETIDITALSTDIFGLNHSGFAERTALLADIRQLIQKGARPPDLRASKLRKIEGRPLPYWKYSP